MTSGRHDCIRPLNPVECQDSADGENRGGMQQSKRELVKNGRTKKFVEMSAKQLP